MPIQLADFDDAVVFVSLPAIPGDTSNDGFASIARVRNVVSSGQVSFEVKLYQANDSFCSKAWRIPAPISPGMSLSWLVAEKGAFDLDDGKYFMIGSGPISREDADVTNSNNFQRFNFPTGCDSPTIPVCYCLLLVLLRGTLCSCRLWCTIAC